MSADISPGKLVGFRNHFYDVHLPAETGKNVSNKLTKVPNENVNSEGILIRNPGSSRWSILIVCCVTDFLFEACGSIHAPFYPQVAEKKGANHTETGLVFGVYQLTLFIMSLVYGSLLLPRIGPKLMAVSGLFVLASSAFLFGFLDSIDDPVTFTWSAILIRMVQANGSACYATASFTIISNSYPTSVAKATACAEGAAGLGLMTGPAIGGALYALGGFHLPFSLLGFTLFGAAIVLLKILPNFPLQDVKETRGMLSLLSIPSIFLCAFSIFCSEFALGFLLPTLEPFVRHNFNLPSYMTGLIFIIDGTTYALCNPLWGWLCDKVKLPRFITLVGLILILISFCIIGPIPVLPWMPNLWVTCVACALFGLGVGAASVSAYVQALMDAKSYGFPDDFRTNGLVSGLWFSMLSLGSFAGATSGGILMEHEGFANGTCFVLCLQAIVAAVTIGFIIHGKRGNPKNIGAV